MALLNAIVRERNLEYAKLVLLARCSLGSKPEDIDKSLDLVYNLLFPWKKSEVLAKGDDLKSLLKEYDA